MPGVKIKFPSTTINAYGAFAQQVEQNLVDSTGDFTIFSSWLSALSMWVYQPVVMDTVRISLHFGPHLWSVNNMMLG